MEPGMPPSEYDPHAQHSVLREKIVEHLFVAEVLRRCWNLGIYSVEVLKPEFDANGYDVVLSVNGKIRFIQLRAAKSDSPKPQSISKDLSQKIGGCVVWISITEQLQIQHFYYFGGRVNERLPSLDDYASSRSTRRNIDGERTERQNHKKVPARTFVRVDTLDKLLDNLFELSVSL